MNDIALNLCCWALLIAVPVIAYRATRGAKNSARLLIALVSAGITWVVIDAVFVLMKTPIH